MPKTPEPITELADAFNQAMAAHATLAPDERLFHVDIGRYAAHLGTSPTMRPEESVIADTYYWQLNIQRTRILAGPSPITSGPTNLAEQRKRERRQIIDAFTDQQKRDDEREAQADG